MKAQNIRSLCVIVCAVLLTACSSVSYVSNEMSGSAKPEGGIKEVIPTSRTYSQSPQAVRQAVLSVLQDQGQILQMNQTGNEIRTEPKTLGAGGMSLVAYSSRLFMTLEGSSVAYRARFDKKSSVVQAETNLEFPEKENELRRDFFAALNKKLQ